MGLQKICFTGLYNPYLIFCKRKKMFDWLKRKIRIKFKNQNLFELAKISTTVIIIYLFILKNFPKIISVTFPDQRKKKKLFDKKNIRLISKSFYFLLKTLNESIFILHLSTHILQP